MSLNIARLLYIILHGLIVFSLAFIFSVTIFDAAALWAVFKLANRDAERFLTNDVQS